MTRPWELPGSDYDQRVSQEAAETEQQHKVHIIIIIMGSLMINVRNMGVRASRERAREAEILAARLHLYGEFDTVIKCEDQEMPCHREVLMEHSAYFR